jgi:hypothetical protein
MDAARAADLAEAARLNRENRPRPAFVEDESEPEPEPPGPVDSSGVDRTASEAWPARERVRMEDSEDSDAPPGTSRLDRRRRFNARPNERRSSSSPPPPGPSRNVRWDDRRRVIVDERPGPPPVVINNRIYNDSASEGETREEYEAAARADRYYERPTIWDDGMQQPRTSGEISEEERRTRIQVQIEKEKALLELENMREARAKYEAALRENQDLRSRRERERIWHGGLEQRPRTSYELYEDERRKRLREEHELERARRELEMLRQAEENRRYRSDDDSDPDARYNVRNTRRSRYSPSPSPPPPPFGRRHSIPRGRRSPSPFRRRSIETPVVLDYDRYRAAGISPTFGRHRYPTPSPQRNTFMRRYIPPFSADTDDDEAPLVETINLPFKGQSTTQVARAAGGMLRAWHKKQMSFARGIETELVVINAAESFTDKGGKSIVTLYCQKDALDTGKTAPHQITWLYVSPL